MIVLINTVVKTIIKNKIITRFPQLQEHYSKDQAPCQVMPTYLINISASS